MARESQKAQGVRPYDNSFREAQAQQTRLRILEGVVREVLEGSVQDFSIGAIAARTGVSVPTIYRHFPNREALLEAVDEHIGQKLGRPRIPESIDELADGAPSLFRFFEDHYDTFRAARTAAQQVRAHAQTMRDKTMEALLAPTTSHLEPARARAVHGLIRALFSFDHYAALRERFGADTRMASEVVGWAARALLAQLARERTEDAAREGDAATKGAPKRAPGRTRRG